MSRGATFYVANPLYHGVSGAGPGATIPQQGINQQNIVPSNYVPPPQHFMPGVVPIGYIYTGQVPAMQQQFVPRPAQPYIPPPVREPQPTNRFSFSFISIWRSFRSLFKVRSDSNDVFEDNQPLVSEEQVNAPDPVTLEHLPQPQEVKADVEMVSDVEQPSAETKETESPTNGEQASRFSFSFSALWISIRSIFKTRTHRSTLEFPPDDEPILSEERENDIESNPTSTTSKHPSKESKNNINVVEHSNSSEKDLYEPEISNQEVPTEPRTDKKLIKEYDEVHDQYYPMRDGMNKMALEKAQTETDIRSTLQVEQRNGGSFDEYTYIDDDDDEPLLPEEESIILSDSEAELPELLNMDQQMFVHIHLENKVPINSSQAVADKNDERLHDTTCLADKSTDAQAKWMALPSPDDAAPQTEIQPDTRISREDESNQYKYYEEQTTLDHKTNISKESRSHDNVQRSNHVVETPSKMYVVEKETIAIATIKSTMVVQTIEAEMQPTEKLAESKMYQHDQLLEGAINTEESRFTSGRNMSQPDRGVSFEITDGPTSVDSDVSMLHESGPSSDKEDHIKSKWKSSVSEDKKPIIESDVFLPHEESISVIGEVQNLSPTGDTSITEVEEDLTTILVADTAVITNQNSVLHQSASYNAAGVTVDKEQRSEEDKGVLMVANHFSKMSSSLDMTDDQLTSVDVLNVQTLAAAPNSTTVEQQPIGDALKPMREELMKRKESGELIKGPKVYHQRQSMSLEDHVKEEELTQGSTETHDPMPHDSVVNITALQIQGDLMTMSNKDDTMNVTMVSAMNAPTDTAIEISQGEIVTDGNEPEKTDAQDITKSEMTIQQEIDKVMPKEDREIYKNLITTVDKLFTDSEKKCCTCSCDCCVQTCCVSLSCVDMQSCFKKGPDNIEVNNITTEALQEGNRVGWKMFNKLVFPLIDRRLFKFLITGFEIILGLIGFIMSCISFSLGNNAGYNIIHFILACAATAFGILDFFTSLSDCMTETCCKNKCERLKSCAASCRTKICCCCTFEDILKGWDVIRIVINELLFYPLLICDLIEFIVDKGYKFQAENGEDVLSLFLFFHSSISLFFYVYILRLILLISMIYHLHKTRKLDPDQKKLATKLMTFANDLPSKQLDSKEEGLDPNIANDAMKFQGYFVYHVAGQMAAQILMIAAICLKLDRDNEFKTLDDPIYISSELWFMLIAGGVMPMFGILTFFIPTFYWVYEYPCGICIDILSILETPGFGHIICYGEETKDMKEKVMNIAKKLNKDQLKKDFQSLRDKALSSKVGYAFQNPILVVLCLVYSIFQLVFVIVAIVGIQSGAPDTVFFYILSIVVGFAANLYVFIVAAFWMTIIIGILVLIAVVIALIVLVILLLSCGGSNSNNNRRSYI